MEATLNVAPLQFCDERGRRRRIQGRRAARKPRNPVSIGLVAFFLDQPAAAGEVDLALERGAAIILDIDRARQSDETGVEYDEFGTY